MSFFCQQRFLTKQHQQQQQQHQQQQQKQHQQHQQQQQQQQQQQNSTLLQFSAEIDNLEKKVEVFWPWRKSRTDRFAEKTFLVIRKLIFFLKLKHHHLCF